MNSNLKWFSYFMMVALMLPSLFSVAVPHSAQANGYPLNVYVKSTMDNDSGNGLTWATAKKFIQSGIGLTDPTGGGTINVWAGTYSLSGSGMINIDHPLTLAGAGSATTIIDGAGLCDSEVVQIQLTTAGTVNMSGFTVQNGYYDGGVWIYENSGVINFNDCVITGNYASYGPDSYGGGIGIESGNTVVMNRCTISGNHAGENPSEARPQSCGALTTRSGSLGYYYNGCAGGIYSENSTLTMNNCILRDNTANANRIALNAVPVGSTDVSGSGGGMVAMDSTVTMTGCAISGNSAWGSGDGFVGYDVSGSGGGVVAINTLLTMAGCTVSGNSASAGEPVPPGSGSNSGAGVEQPIPFEFYAAGSGGGIVAVDGPLTMTGCTVQGNHASSVSSGPAANSQTNIGYDVSGSGGGIVTVYSPLTMSNNCIVRDNTATGSGILPLAPGENVPIDGIGFSRSSGGGLVALFNSFKIDYGTFDNNTATGLGGGIVYGGISTIDQPGTGAGSSGLKWHSGHSLGTGTSTSAAITPAEMNDFTLTNNRSADGGGLVQIGSTLTLNRGMISNNTATDQGGWGGGILAFLNATLNMNGCTVTGNQAGRWGGGIFYGLTIGSQPGATISNCNIDGNLAGGAGGGLFVLEAYLYNESIGNESAISGDMPNYRGTLKNLAGFVAKSRQFARSGLSQPIPGAITLNNCTISNNEAMNWGGGMASVFGGYELHACTFSGNAAGGLGGGIGTFLSIGELVNCTVSGNMLTPTDFSGRLTSSNPTGNGTLSVGDGQVSSAGGGLGMLTSYTYFECDIIANNLADRDSSSYGGGLFNSIGVPGASSEFVNTIIANNTAAQASTNNCYNRGQITSFGHNIDSLNQCGFTAIGDKSIPTPCWVRCRVTVDLLLPVP